MDNGVSKFASTVLIAFAIASPVCRGQAGKSSPPAAGLNDRSPAIENMDPQQRKPLPEGTWGGPGIQMSVSSDSASIQFDCADGGIPGKIYVRDDGAFSADGTFTKRRPGPARPNEPPPAAARYTGKITGSKLTLRITLTADGSEVGEFTLEHGKSGRLVRCL